MLEPYVWYDPWELIKKANDLIEVANWKLSEADELEYRVGRNLNAMAKAHEHDTYRDKQMNANLLEKITSLDLVGYMNPRIILK